MTPWTGRFFAPTWSGLTRRFAKSAAGCKPTCRVLMFKLLILQRLYGLSDERLEYQVRDRLSFMRFLGLGLDGKIPDARTVWAFREALKRYQLADVLFERLNWTLADVGWRCCLWLHSKNSPSKPSVAFNARVLPDRYLIPKDLRNRLLPMCHSRMPLSGI